MMGPIAWVRREQARRRAHIDAWREACKAGSDGLSPFQVDCELHLRALMGRFGLDLAARAIQPISETGDKYIHGLIGQTQWQLFIYEDGVEVSQSEKTLIRLEQWDAATPRDLMSRAGDELEAAIRGGTISGDRPA